MTVLYLLVPLAVVIAIVAVAGFAWAARRGQFDDLDTPALRALRDDQPVRSRRPDDATPPNGQ
ncbi:MAG: cbb3-type cytochrome oxidase assembly protein CcoS [Gemmatimonadales bacterium]